MKPEQWIFIILFIVIIGFIAWWLRDRKKKGDFDIGRKMRMANDARNARQTLIAK
jgi:hypothetical protein